MRGRLNSNLINPRIATLQVVSWHPMKHLSLEHYSDVRMSAMASHITGVLIVCSPVCSGIHKRKHQSAASLACVKKIYRWTVDYLHKEQVTRKIFPFDDVIMQEQMHSRCYAGSSAKKIIHSASSWISSIQPSPKWYNKTPQCFFRW